MSMELPSEVIIAYFSPYTSQREKQEAQNTLETYLEESYNDWQNIMMLMKDLTLDSLQNLGSDIMEVIKLQWPLQALSYIVEKKFDKIADPQAFYSNLFDLYQAKCDIIQQNSLFFGKFVLVFTNLALYDKSDENFNATLTEFKNLIETPNDPHTITHVKFIAKYLKYLYEDSFENLENNKLSFKKEIILKRKFCANLITSFRRTVTENPDELVDDIMIGLSCLYIFKSANLEPEDRSLFCDLRRYSDLNSFIQAIGKILEYSLINPEDLEVICSTFNEIVQSPIEETTLEMLSLSLFDIVKCSFDVQIEEAAQGKIIDFIFSILENTDGRYKAWMHLIEALSQYVRMVPPKSNDTTTLLYPSEGGDKDLGSKICEICIQKAKYPYFFDAQTKVPLKEPSTDKYRYRNGSDKGDKQDSEPEDEDMDINMTTEETNFVFMRQAIKTLIFECCLKMSSVESLLAQTIDIGNTVLANEGNVQTEELEYQVEAVLWVFLDFLEGVRDLSKIQNYSFISEKVQNFFLNDHMKEMFVGKNTHWLISKKYLDCLVQLYQFMKDNDSKKSLTYDALTIFFQDNVLLSGDPAIICYYLNTFLMLIDKCLPQIEEEECVGITERVQKILIPLLTGSEPKYSNKTFILFQVLGAITQSPKRDNSIRVEATKNAFNFITEMFNNASNLYQFRLCQKCILSYLSKFNKVINPEIGWLFYYIQELFVSKACPDFTIDKINTEAVWDVRVNYKDPKQKQIMVQLRKLIYDVYSYVFRRIDFENLVQMFKISFPVIISCLSDPVDSFTGEAPTIDALTRCMQTLHQSLEKYEPSIIDLMQGLLYRCLTICYSIYQRVKHEHSSSSYAFTECAGLCDSFLKLIQRIVFLDCHVLFIKNGESDFVCDLLEFLTALIHNPLTIKCTEGAVNIVLNLVKELTPYEEEIEIAKKKDQLGTYENKCIQNSGNSLIPTSYPIPVLTLISTEGCDEILVKLEQVSSQLIKDYIFEVDPQLSKNRDIIGILCELLYVRAKLDPQLMEDYRKYWKSNNINYRCVLEIKAAIDEATRNENNLNIYWIRGDISVKVTNALKEYSLKRMIEECSP